MFKPVVFSAALSLLAIAPLHAHHSYAEYFRDQKVSIEGTLEQLTLGLFIFVINGLIFLGVAHLVAGFQVLGFWHAVGASIVFSLISWLLSSLVQR